MPGDQARRAGAEPSDDFDPARDLALVCEQLEEFVDAAGDDSEELRLGHLADASDLLLRLRQQYRQESDREHWQQCIPTLRKLSGRLRERVNEEEATLAGRLLAAYARRQDAERELEQLHAILAAYVGRAEETLVCSDGTLTLTPTRRFVVYDGGTLAMELRRRGCWERVAVPGNREVQRLLASGDGELRAALRDACGYERAIRIRTTAHDREDIGVDEIRLGSV